MKRKQRKQPEQIDWNAEAMRLIVASASQTRKA